MNELIRINKESKTVSARDLHTFLEATERFSTWFERQLQYGFVEGQEFTTVKSFTLVNNGAKKEIDDFALTLDCAKEIAMVQRTEKGKEARQYFIACEKRLKEISAAPIQPELFDFLEPHTKKPVQVQNSKDINKRMYAWSVDTIIKYNRENCLIVTQKYPSDWVEIAKKEGLRASQRSSGKEVLRHLRPGFAAQMSLNDSLVQKGVRLKEANTLSAPCLPMLEKLIELKALGQ